VHHRHNRFLLVRPPDILDLVLTFHLLDVMFCTAQDGMVLMFPTNLTNNSTSISVTIHSCARSEVTEVQMHEVDLSFESLLMRDGQAALPCWFPKLDVQTIVNYVTTV